MDTIDWTKPIEIFENGEWRSVEFVAEDATDVCFRLNGNLRIWDKDDEDIRNRPPVPAPAACEQKPESWYTNSLVWSTKLGEQAYQFKCKKCGGIEERPSRRGYEPPACCYACVKAPSPSPSPAPDSVAQAERLVAEYGAGDAPDAYAWCKFLSLYISEQTAQRKAAGELAKAELDYMGDHAPTDSVFWNVHRAIAADAQARAGKENRNANH